MSSEIIIAIIALAGALFGGQGFWTWLINRKNAKSNESKLLMGIAYSIIIKTCDMHIRRGYIEVDEYNELDRYLYKPYRAKGGDGTAERMMKLVEKLPSTPPNEVEK